MKNEESRESNQLKSSVSEANNLSKKTEKDGLGLTATCFVVAATLMALGAVVVVVVVVRAKRYSYDSLKAESNPTTYESI